MSSQGHWNQGLALDCTCLVSWDPAHREEMVVKELPAHLGVLRPQRGNRGPLEGEGHQAAGPGAVSGSHQQGPDLQERDLWTAP